MIARAKFTIKWGFGLPLLAAYIALAFAPAKIWFNPRSVVVSDAVNGATPFVTVDRAINYSFHGSYTVDVRNVQTGLIACGMPGAHRYRGGLDGTFTTDLVDWAGGDERCASLPPGNYVVETCWSILSPLWGALPPKRICAAPDDFRITGE